MAYEFKKLSKVDTVETVSDTASVLIEENGVIKRAPKTEVGGKSAEWDVVIHLEGGYTMETVESFELVQGSFDELYEKIKSKKMPKACIYWHYHYGEYSDKCTNMVSFTIWNDEDRISIDFFISEDNRHHLYMHPNNEVRYGS